MSVEADPPSRSARRARRRRRIAIWTASAAAGVLVLAAGLYSLRGAIGTHLASSYLEARGVPSDIDIERLGPSGFTGSLRLGPADDPDLTVEHIEVTFDLFPEVRQGFFAPSVRTVKLENPQLKARYADGKLTFGTLQRLVDDFLARPAVGPPPDVTIRRGGARVVTAAGDVRVGGDLDYLGGRLAMVEARMPAQRLAADGRALDLKSASLSLKGEGDRLAGRLTAEAPLLVRPGAEVQGAVLSAALDLPYGTGPAAFDGRYGVDATFAADRVTQGANRASDAKMTLALAGQSSGGLDRLNLTGQGAAGLDLARLEGGTSVTDLHAELETANLRLVRGDQGLQANLDLVLAGAADRLATADTRLTDVVLTGRAGEVEFRSGDQGTRLSGAPTVTVSAVELRSGGATGRDMKLDLASDSLSAAGGQDGWRTEGPLSTRMTLARLTAGDATLSGLSLDGRGRFSADGGGLDLDWRGAARSRGGTSAADARRLAARVAGVVPDEAAFARAMQSLRLDAPDIRLAAADGAVNLNLGAPVRLSGEGAELVIRSGRGPLARLDGSGLGGALTVAASGPALPALTLDLTSYRLGGAGLTAQASLAMADLNAGPLRGIDVKAAGRIAPIRGGYAFTASGCADVHADSLQGADGPTATDLTARVCPYPGRPSAASVGAGWAVAARFEAAGATLPPAELEIGGAAGQIYLAGSTSGLTAGEVELASGAVADRAAAPRFQPVSGSGQARLDGQVWRGDFQIATVSGSHRLAEVTLTHDMTTAQGAAQIDARGLAFAPDGLQPAHISPIVAGVITEAAGTADFVGQIGWGHEGMTSSGRLGTEGLDFRSSFGRVTRASGSMDFTSLAPLTTEPEQTIAIQHIDWVVPLDNALLGLTLTPTEAKIMKAQVDVGGGTALLDPLDLKIGAILPTSGTLRLANIDMNRLLSEFNLSDKVSLEAKVDGVVPFSFTDEGVRFQDGRIFADGPGRLSIKREALSGVSASDDSAATPPNAVQNFAYQAMEDLAFTELDAQIASRPEGRLGMIFHLNGRHDPPVGRPARIGIFELVQGTAFQRDIPLPKGTPVNLTLDTSLNFDELLQAYSSLGRSTAVQP